ncbi:hypothetical protein L207DRAFT_525387 [Hyaloscypha variabilis F]|uniref:Tyrosine phosphatase n=1 Tax=Hyaloscypha variabilis (strain UAMH 11265 / GT02V1 / F) TaxID=1149755 RepID=A0A2J6RZT0_HYAVF|nr:hypothetical protein L207DRAFT_525387 [Hyaloscypha variabilis F]
MSEKMNAITISRRSNRLFVEEQQLLEAGKAGGHESRQISGDEKERDRPQRETVSTSSSIKVLQMPVVELGMALCPIFPTTSEDIGKQVIKSLQVAKASAKVKTDARPINFGVVLPGSIFRSSYPSEEDYEYLDTLGLKTILSLVKKDPFPDHFSSFMQRNDIRHCVINMQGTKKVEIPEVIMRSIMTVALDDSNYPILIHCNHGKHRTGCAVAVLRHVTGWNLDSVLEEYRAYAEPKVRECDVTYIKEYQVSNLQGLFADGIHRFVDTVLAGPRMAQMFMFTAMMMVILLATALFW